MADTKKVEIKAAKGRPMLQWVGKKPLRDVIAYPAQLVEAFAPDKAPKTDKNVWKNWPEKFFQGGLLFHGDNKDVLAHLLANGFRGKVKLIYIDPPFDSGANYVRAVKLRKGNTTKFDGEDYTLGEQIQYTDIWANDNYLQFMYERLLLLREILSDDGTICLHCDANKVHFLRCLLDEVFSFENFLNEVIWDYRRWPTPAPEYQKMHDNILIYTKTKGEHVFNRQYMERTESTEKRWKGKSIVAAHTESGERVPSDYGEGKSVGSPYNDVWYVPIVAPSGYERTEYPTQKPEALIKRLVMGSTNRGDIVFDCFIGSGTTAAVVQKLGRHWIGADINKGAIQTTSKRLQGVIEEQLKSAKSKTKALPGMEEETIAPAQYSFSVYRVNDYDLQVQHNEALNLACEHLGITRTKTDAFFDGTLGKKLVKTVPFNHPITPLDLEEVKRELGNRPQEERDVVVVGYGKELAVQTWLEDWNRNRKRTGLPNQIDVKDLRVDTKSGGFFLHKPAEANIKFKRAGDKVSIEIADFLSPTVIERLKSQAGILTPQIKDWRSMVDSVMIDSNYDGKVFNITLADVPEKKNDLVVGKYEVEAKKGSTIAVKITDMLGEEVLVVKEV